MPTSDPNSKPGDAPRSPPADAGNQREALSDSERKAAVPRPESFKDEAMTEKVVEIPPVSSENDQPIKGLDPK